VLAELILGDVRIEANATFRVSEANRLGAGYPVSLGRTNASGPRRLEFLVDLAHVVGNVSALLKVESLHIGHGLVNSTDRRRITDGALRPIPRTQVLAVDATDSDLTHDQLLSALGVACRDILLCCSEDLNHLRSDVALTVRQRVLVRRHGQKHALRPVLLVLLGMVRVAAAAAASASSVVLVWTRRRGVVGIVVVFSAIVVPLTIVVLLVRQYGEWRSS
jgi:hypothetical protein